MSTSTPDFSGFTYAGNGSSPATTDSGGTDAGISLTGLSSLFSSVGSAFSTSYRAVNPTVTPPAGALVYNPSTGQYVSPAALNVAAATSSMTPIIVLALVALGIYLVIRR